MSNKIYSPVGVSNEMYSLIKKETNWTYVSGRILRGNDSGYTLVVNKINGFYYLNMFEHSENVRELTTSAINPKFSVMRKTYVGIKQLVTSLTGLEILDDRVEKDIFLDKFREIYRSGYDFNIKGIGNGSAAILSIGCADKNNLLRVASIIQNSSTDLKEIDTYINDYIRRNK